VASPVAAEHAVARLTRLAYELLDAHDDTARLAAASPTASESPRWDAHLDYLRALQRVGRRELAEVCAGAETALRSDARR